ncbi:MAG: TlpA family protein disulfide reductase [Clostridiales bacterium]|nr:TlpA family protein disulfide reductase [Clostridiales bacterium]
MKKIISMIICTTLLISLASCDSSSKTTKKTKKDRTEKTEKDIDSGTSKNESDPEDETEAVTGDKVIFSTVDRDGNSYDESVFAGNELTLINFWEPWCGPCVGEIPDLEELYEEYKDDGLLIIGVYSENGMEDEVDEILEDSDVSYPILRYSYDFDIFQTGYVPTTILVDRNGNIIDTGEASYDGIDSTMIVGSKSYDEWEDIITDYLGN